MGLQFTREAANRGSEGRSGAQRGGGNVRLRKRRPLTEKVTSEQKLKGGKKSHSHLERDFSGRRTLKGSGFGVKSVWSTRVRGVWEDMKG